MGGRTEGTDIYQREYGKKYQAARVQDKFTRNMNSHKDRKDEHSATQACNPLLTGKAEGSQGQA